MNKTAIKNYAVWARVQLIEAVKQRAFEYEITENGEYNANLDSINGRVLTAEEKEQRSTLIQLINQKGYEQVMEEAAYTWFNRFIALRFMEVNGYLPSKTRVFTDENNQFKPEILKQAMTVELDGLDKEKVLDLIENQKNEELYKYLLITQCNALNSALPEMFEKIGGWTELLFPFNLLKTDSVIERMIKEIPEDNWTDQVEIIGWFYQFYNTELFNLVYDGNNSKRKIEKEQLPAATQLFTPDWVVRYMVENSLGRIAVSNKLLAFCFENEGQRQLKEIEIATSYGWKYYLAELEQTPEIRELLTASYTEQVADLKQLCVLDPCMGSGHILVYSFEVLMEIYKSQGYSERDAAKLIVENNLYGLEIDDRAAQLAYFAVMMKARSYDRRFLTRGIQLNLCAIKESNNLNTDCLELFETLRPTAQKLVNEFIDAKEYGSILNLRFSVDELTELKSKYDEIDKTVYDNFFDSACQAELRKVFYPLIKQAMVMVHKYDVVCTNPPYLGGSRFDKHLNAYINKNYRDEKADIAAVVLSKMLFCFAKNNGYIAAVTTVSWMFIRSFKAFREKVLETFDFVNLVDFGTELFDGKIGHLPVVAWVNRKSNVKQQATAIRLVDYCYSRRNEKESEFFNSKNRFVMHQNQFAVIPGSPIAYWVSENLINSYRNPVLSEFAEITNGLFTCDNKRFVRLWYEVNNENINFHCKSKEENLQCDVKWYPYNKGGDFRRWYGNQEHVVNFYRFGEEISEYRIKSGQSSSFPGQEFYFHKSISWSFIGFTKLGIRYYPNGFIFDIAGSSIFSKNNGNAYYILAFLASVVAFQMLSATNPTINFQAGNIRNLPIIIDQKWKEIINEITTANISISKKDWNAFETSWDFKKHPLV